MFFKDTNEWIIPQTKGIKPEPLAFHTCCVVDTKIYFFGGFNGTHLMNELFVFETSFPIKIKNKMIKLLR